MKRIDFVLVAFAFFTLALSLGVSGMHARVFSATTGECLRYVDSIDPGRAVPGAVVVEVAEDLGSVDYVRTPATGVVRKMTPAEIAARQKAIADAAAAAKAAAIPQAVKDALAALQAAGAMPNSTVGEILQRRLAMLEARLDLIQALGGGASGNMTVR